jgi:hypothetical protein
MEFERPAGLPSPCGVPDDHGAIMAGQCDLTREGPTVPLSLGRGETHWRLVWEKRGDGPGSSR